jgi:hypothetical protein
MPKKIELSVLIYQDGDTWVAQALEHDVAAFAETATELTAAFERAVAANLCANADLGRKGLDGIPAAPPRFQAMFDDSDFDMIPRHTPSGPVRIGAARFAEAA